MKKLALLAFLLTITTIVFGQDIANNTIKTVSQSGIGLGSIMAVVTSWDRNRSLGYAIINGIFGWFYVIFFAITDNDNRLRKMDK